jgi:anti-sigma factor RsiW
MSNEDRCIDPNAIAPDDLIAFMHDEASKAVEQHLQACAYCRREVAAYTAVDALLSSPRSRADCIDTTALMDYSLGLLDLGQARAVREHMASCPHCYSESRSISRFLAEPDAPEQAPAGAGLLRGLRRLFAQPLAPSALGRAGLRGSGPPASMVYAVEDLRLTLEVQSGGPGQRTKVIAGIIEDPAPALDGAAVRLIRGGAVEQAGTLDDLGAFMFSGVSAGAYSIEVEAEDALVVIEPVDIS